MKNEINSVPKMKKIIENILVITVENLFLLFIVKEKLIGKISSEFSKLEQFNFYIKKIKEVLIDYI